MNKSELRKMIAHSYTDLTDQYKKAADEAIRGRILSLPEYNEASVVFCFVGTSGEIDTGALIDTMLDEGKTVCVPLCSDKGTMTARKISGRDELSAGKYGIPEPPADAETIPPSQIDLAVVPCVTCNKIGQRLGHGGGYYDRYLQGQDINCVLVCREETMTAAVPTEPHDIRFDTVVSERRVYRNGSV